MSKATISRLPRVWSKANNKPNSPNSSNNKLPTTNNNSPNKPNNNSPNKPNNRSRCSSSNNKSTTNRSGLSPQSCPSQHRPRCSCPQGTKWPKALCNNNMLRLTPMLTNKTP